MSNEKLRLLNAEVIQTLLHETSLELGQEGPGITIVMVGGSLMAMHGLREATTDVDTVNALEGDLLQAVFRVAEKHSLSKFWLNNSSSPFAPEVIDHNETEIQFQNGRLTVLGFTLRQLFLMKVSSNRRRDHDDLVTLWPHTNFKNSHEVLTAYHHAYPSAPSDEFLQSWLDEIIRRSSNR